jgi:hypothetical protein
MGEGIDRFIILPEDLGMIGVGGDTLEPVEDDLLERYDIGVFAGLSPQSDFFPLGNEALDGLGRGEGGRGVGEIDMTPRVLNPLLQPLPQIHALPDPGSETIGVEVDIGEGGEYSLKGKKVSFRICDSHFPALGGMEGNPLQDMDQKVLQR